VLCEQREIRLHTEFQDIEPFEYTDVIFRGVFAYRFVEDNFSTILFDIAEIPVEDILTADQELFESGRNYGWPGIWNDSMETLRAYLAENAARGFRISPSFGMGGWVLAQSMELIAVTPSA
jgi:hypothetical protein